MRYVYMFLIAMWLLSANSSSYVSLGFIDSLLVPPAKRSRIIGAGGMNIKRIQSVTGVTISSNSESQLDIHAPNQACLDEAKQLLQQLIDQQVCPN